MKSIYQVKKISENIVVDANWNKPHYEEVVPLDIDNFMGNRPKFFPRAQAKVLYNNENIFVIFKVVDRYVRAIETNYCGKVWEDSCVEFFFSPGTNEGYFNIEVNCIGTVLFKHQSVPHENVQAIELTDFKKMEFAHTLPKKIIEPEREEQIKWIMEYKLPINILEKYSLIKKPEPGVKWFCNFYKCSENNSNPHWLTWAPIENEKPDFHKPEYFGILEFN